MKIKYTFIYLSVFILLSCQAPKNKNAQFTVVTTTTMITDLLKTIGGDAIEVQGMMGAGVDPHLYKASAGDLEKIQRADLIVYNGLHLEGKLVSVLKKMDGLGKTTLALGDFLPEAQVIHSENFISAHDPHIWFSVENWKLITQQLVEKLSEIIPEHQAVFLKNGTSYLASLTKLQGQLKKQVSALPHEKRVLVTAHDAFSYFGKEFGFKVVGLQGLSTASEAGVKDVQRLANFIVDHQIKSVFVESSVPKRTIEALQAAVKAKGFWVEIGGELFSDALGQPNTAEGTYIGMYKHNVKTIVEGLQ